MLSCGVASFGGHVVLVALHPLADMLCLWRRMAGHSGVYCFMYAFAMLQFLVVVGRQKLPSFCLVVWHCPCHLKLTVVRRSCHHAVMCVVLVISMLVVVLALSPDEGIPGRAGYFNIVVAQVAVAECSSWPGVFTSPTVSVGLLGSARSHVLL